MSNARVRPAQQAQSMEPEETGAMGCVAYLMQAGSIFLFILFFPFSLCYTLKVIQEYERGVIFRLGRVVSGEKGKGPGVTFILPCIDELRLFDMRTRSYDIRPQQVLTKDSMNLTIDAVVFSRVVRLTRSVMYLRDPHHSTRLLAATTLRKFVGTKTMGELLSNRRLLSVHMQNVLDRTSSRWGMKVERVDLKDIQVPLEMQRAMAIEAETERNAKAKLISADGEMKASHALKEAANVISQSEVGLKLRSLETLRSISKKNNNTVVLPVPPRLLDALLRRKR